VEFSELLAARHSVREFADRVVDREVLERVLDAASFAPSSMNEQPWCFYVAEGATRARVGEVMAQSTVYLADYIDILGPERYEEASRWYTDLGGAPIVVGVTIPRTDDEPTFINRVISVGAAVQNVLLAATNEGLGACMVTFSFWVRDQLAEAFGLAADRVVVGLVALGYPSGTPESPTRSHDIAVFRE
jgi:nitroreductase